MITKSSSGADTTARPGGAGTSVSRDFSYIRDAYYEAWFRFHPERAVDLGVPGHAHRLTPCGDEEIGALVVLNEKLLSALDELAPSELDADDALDFRLMQGAAFLELSELLENDWRLRDPQKFLPLRAVYQLTIRAVEDFPAALKSRLGGIPACLRGARQCLSSEPENIPAAWLEAAIEEATSGSDYLASLPRQVVVRDHSKRLRNLPVLIAEAQDALGEFVKFLEGMGDRAQGDHACGERRFNDLLKYRHFLAVDAHMLHGAGVRLVAALERDLARAAKRLGGHVETRALGAVPDAAQLLSVYAETMQAARAFVAARELATLPEAETLRVVETPLFMRHQIPFAAYCPPAPGEDQVGRYYVTPVTDPEALAEHNLVSAKHTCVHEAYPGHHLQFVTANLHPPSRTWPRLVNASATLYEGWALYCEQLMCEQGFLSGPEHEYVLLRDRLWRAVRVVLDVELNTRNLSVEEAAQRLHDMLGFPMAQARADVSWYIRAPTTPMGYAVGWALINAARDARREMKDYAPKSFHDAILSCGSIPLPLVLERCFGAEFADRIRDSVFAA